MIPEFELKISEIIKHFKNQLAAIRASRPSSKLVEDILVEYFDQKLTVKQLGSISIIPPREIQISVWDKQIISAIAKAIETKLNISASTEGNLIRINLPPLSAERRAELIKIVKKEAEETRIKIRHLRDEQNKKNNQQLEEKKISEDTKFKLKEEVQKIIDKSNKDIETMLENKIREIEE